MLPQRSDTFPRRKFRSLRDRLGFRDTHRKTTCRGCRHNYYNFPKQQSPNGDVEVKESYSCWHLDLIHRGKCPIHSRP